MTLTTDRLHLPLMAAAQAQKHVTHNEALLALDALVQLGVLDRVSSPPSAPAAGARHLVAPGATGGFAGQDDRIAINDGGVWRFLTPQIGWRLFVAQERRFLVFDGVAWGDVPMRFAPLLGVNAIADDTTKLAVSSAGVLFNHAGAGVQARFNKAASGQTAAALYQTNWSGRAETGLTGDDDFHLKVSPDGAVWRDALIADHDSGRVSFPQGVVGGDRAGFRNLLRNSAFSINQRAVSGPIVLGPGQYGHDGVKAGAGGATYTATAQGAGVMLTVSAGSVILPVEAAMIDGGVYRLAHDGAAQARVWQGGGVAGSGAFQDADRAAGGLALAGLAAATQTNVEFAVGSILRPQLETGGVATQFERRPPAVEMALCQYYFLSYVQPGSATIQFSGYVGAAGQYAIIQFFYPRMRAAPTVQKIGAWTSTNVDVLAFGAAQPGGCYAALRSLSAGFLIAYSPANGGFTLSAEI